MENARNGPRASALAMIICEETHYVEGRGMWRLINTFVFVNAGTFPYTLPRIHVYVLLATETQDPEGFDFFVSAPDGRIIWQGRMNVQQWGSSRTIEFDFNLGGIVFPVPGEYSLRLVGDGHELMARTLFVRPKAPGGREQIR